MKKQSLFIGIILMSIGIVSCNTNTELSTEYYEVQVKEALTEGAEDSISVSVSLEYPVSGVSKQVLNRITSHILGKGTNSEETDIQKAVEEYISTTVTNYKETNLPLYEEVQQMGSRLSGMTWEDMLNGFFSGYYNNMVSYTLSAFSYTGGAHGNSGVYCVNFNLKDGSIVQESDLFKEGYEETLSKLLTSHLPEALPDPSHYEALFVKELTSNGNFCISEDYLTYMYGEYEIGPYYLGTIEISIPWSELESILE